MQGKRLCLRVHQVDDEDHEEQIYKCLIKCVCLRYEVYIAYLDRRRAPVHPCSCSLHHPSFYNISGTGVESTLILRVEYIQLPGSITIMVMDR